MSANFLFKSVVKCFDVMVWGIVCNGLGVASYYFLFSVFNSHHCKTLPFILLLIEQLYVVR